ncbi:YARHG domain-containing protein [Flavobacterium sp. ASW18X]|uniref:YARHG domain-containing protein n=1 Tax=Flavobacterium sp. ASW18X TaxID=2572595 RepID=UPI001469C0DD|nr:YARHG domain-containing protein [Flavobacterium sp. ASW18X]
MTTKIIQLVLLLTFIVNVNTQTSKVWEGDVTPKDLDTFLEGGYTAIKGDLKIGKTKLTQLAQLKSLKVVNGNVSIGIQDYTEDVDDGNEGLQSLAGLENLTEITGKLFISGNDALENIDALKNLKKVHWLNISNNAKIITLKGLSNLSGELLGGLEIYKNKRLESLSSLSGITGVGRVLSVHSLLSIKSLEGLHNVETIKEGDISVSSNANLKDLKGLRKLKIVEESVYIQSNPLLENLEGLEKLTEVGEYLNIKQNHNLKNLEGLSSLKSIGGGFYVTKNDNLTALNGIKKLSTLQGNLKITENPLLTDISAINSLKGTVKGIYIGRNPSLREINGLNNIVGVAENVQIYKNHLERITGFNGLKTIGEGLSLVFNHIKDFNAFENLTSVEDLGIGTNLEVVDLTNTFKNLRFVKDGFFLRSEETLKHFSGPNAIAEIGKIVVTDNEKLESLSGFNGLKTVRENIDIKKNKRLNNVQGFNSLVTLTGTFNIVENPVLKSIQGFKNIDFISYLYVHENSELVDLSGFSNLKSADEIFLRRNYALEDLTGFRSLEKVYKDLDLSYLSELKSLNGLQKLMFIGNQLDFTDNKKLIDYTALQIPFLETITNKNLWFSRNGYSPYKTRMLIHDRLDTRIIPEEYLKLNSRWELSLLRNEIFARRGFDFGSSELTEFFSNMGWYQPVEGVEIVLNDIEEENVRLIKMYEQERIEAATKAIQGLKNKYQNSIDFSSDYEKYYAILRKFINAIAVKSVAKSNKLTYSRTANLDRNLLLENGAEDVSQAELDKISIDFNHEEETTTISIEDNRIEEDEYDSWLVKELINFKFKVKDGSTVNFLQATGEYL